MADRAKFLDFMDMIDGGGRGQMGGEFKGGGIFSEIANLIATPYGSEDPERRRRLQERRRARGLLDMDAIGTKEEQAAAAARAANGKNGPPPAVVGKLTSRLDGKDGIPRTVSQTAAMEDAYGVSPAMISGPITRGGQRGPRGVAAPAPSYANMYMGEAGRGVPNLPRPVATTAALSPAGNTASGTAPVFPMSEQLAPMAPAVSTPQYPSAMSPSAPAMPQGVMSFRDFVDAERAAMSGADRYLDPANYRRGYARYLSSMGINPATMGM